MATRELTSDFHSASISPVKNIAGFVQMDFGSESIYLTNAAYDITWNGQNWRGVAQMGQVESVEEVIGVSAKALRFTISGVDTTKLGMAMTENFRNLPAKFWLGLIEPGTGIIPDPVQVFIGRMSEMIVQRGNIASISVTVESAMAAWGRPNTRRFSDADQQSEYPGDLGLQYVAEISSGRELIWGRT